MLTCFQLGDAMNSTSDRLLDGQKDLEPVEIQGRNKGAKFDARVVSNLEAH